MDNVVDTVDKGARDNMEKLYTMNEVADIIGVTRRTVDRFTKEDYMGPLKPLKKTRVGKSIRVRERDLERFLGQASMPDLQDE